MGLNICVTQPRDVGKYLFWDDVPLNEWDHVRMTGDREFAGIYCNHTTVHHSDECERTRPVDFDTLMNDAIKLEEELGVNKGRFTSLVELLRNNDNYWLYFSW